MSGEGLKITFNTYRDFLDSYFSISPDGYLIRYNGNGYVKTNNLVTDPLPYDALFLNKHLIRRTDFLALQLQ